MNTKHLFSNHLIILLASLCVWMSAEISTLALPFTTHLDPLIAELQARSAALAGSTNKIEIKQKKAIDKVLASFDKDFLSILSDIKVTAKAAKALAKAFPEEFVSAPVPLVAAPHGIALTNLDEIIQSIIDAFGGDLANIHDTAQALLDVAPANPCKDKAQALLDDVAIQLALLPSAPDSATAFKILSDAAKNALKGATIAETVDTCSSSGGGGGGGGGGHWYDMTVSATVNGTKTTFYVNVLNGSPDLVNANYFNSGYIEIIGARSDYSEGITMGTYIGSPVVTGSHPITGTGYYYKNGTTYPFTSGTLTITKWPSSFPGQAKGTFSFTGSSLSGTSGTFTLWIYGAM